MMAVNSVSYFFFQVSVCTTRKMWIYFNIFLVIWILCYNTSVTGEPRVIGTSQAVLAKVGDDVTLPCHIEPSVDATRMTVEWTRPDLKPEFVYLHQDGHYNTDDQNPLYKERVFLFADKLSDGNISLKLFGVTLSDEGGYKCFVPILKTSSLIQLLVGAVSQPVISVIGPKDGGSSLTCDSGCWYPQPDVSWLDSEGNLLINESSVTVSHTQHCYHVQKNVTVRRTGRVTCRVHLPHFNHTVEIHHVIPIAEIRTVISIAEHVIPESSALSPGVIAAIVCSVFTVIVILVAAPLAYLHDKKKKQTRDLADGLPSIEMKDKEKAVTEKFEVTVDDQEDQITHFGHLAGGVTSPLDGLTSIEEKARFVMENRKLLKANVSRVMAVVGSLGSKVDPELRTEMETIPSSIGKMILLYYMVLDKGDTDTRAAFYDALKKHEPNSLEKNGAPLTQGPFDGLTSEEMITHKAQLVIQHGTTLMGNVSEVMPIVESIKSKFRNQLKLNAKIRGKETSSQMMSLYTMELEQGTPEIKAAFYDALKQYEPHLLDILGLMGGTVSQERQTVGYVVVPIVRRLSIRSSTLEDYHPGTLERKGKARKQHSDAETTRSNRGPELLEITEHPNRGQLGHRRSNTADNVQDLCIDRYDEDGGQRGQDGSEHREGPVERERLATDGEDKMDPNTENHPLLAETEDHLEPYTDRLNQSCL